MKKLYSASKDDKFLEFWKREIGFSAARTFSRRISASEAVVKQLDLYGKLNGHQGCVNTINFNSTGDILVSGSDDKQVILWDWATKTSKLSYPSGHLDNIFQAKFMPFTDDRKIVTASADGQVRLGQVLENGEVDTKRLGKHQGRVHSLAVEPGSPYIFYSCGEDGFVKHYDLRNNPRSTSATKLLCCSSLVENNKQSSHSIRLNAIVIDPRNPNYFAVGGSDEYARVYDIRKYQLDAPSNSHGPVNTFCPRHFTQRNDFHITALAYSNTSELLISYNDELIYLFQKNMGLGPNPLSVPHEEVEKLEEPQVYSGHRNLQTIKGVNFFGPNDEYVMSGSDCGNIFIWKKKGAQLVRLMRGDKHIVNQLEPHPHISVLATSGIEKNIKLWAPSSNDVSPLPHNVQEIMDANRRGREDHSRVTLTPDVIMHVLRLHRRQAMAYAERRYNREDVESDEEDGEAIVLGYSEGDSEEGGNSRECNVS
ncbi:DDB1- and CUL4-associated factor 8 [Ipomoea triloba]|uniref:DDB1- and CUL4-associated factor 8 n=1 Tax=Ipomoea triloba TaxID=35885 RepID=UPI00125E1D53|nr:DDB1- and CUL4-associated factor 8 [Ipomoea triloba]